MDMPKSKPVASKDNFLCVECGSTFIHHASLLRHRLRFHISGHKCSLCNMELRISESEVGGFSDLKKHMLEAHQISTFYSCGCCCWIFSNKSSLHMHCKSMSTSGSPGPAEPIATLLTDAYNAPEKSDNSDEVAGTNENKPSPPVSKKKIARRSSGPRPKKISTDAASESMLNNLYSYLTTLNQSMNAEAVEEEKPEVKESLVSSPNSSELNSHDGEKSLEGETTDQSDVTNPDSSLITNELMELLAKNLEKPAKSESKSKSSSSELLYCRDCGVSFSNKSSLYRHSMKIHLDAHICSLCDEEILVSSTDGSDNMMRRHMLTLHNINNVYTCSCCFWAFDNKKDLYNHNHTMSTQGKPGDSRKIATSRKKQVPVDEGLTHTMTEDFFKLFNNDLNNIFNCLKETVDKDETDLSEEIKPTAAESVSSDHSDNENANEGLDIPSSEEDESSKQDPASLRVPDQDGSLKRPDLKGQFCCLDCGKYFCHSASLHRHRAKAHPNDFECLLCNTVIQKAKSVKEHMLNEHQIPTAPVCWCCGWYFENKKLLKVHVENMKKYGDTKDVVPLAKSTGGGRPPVNRKKSKSSEAESLKELNDFSSFVALFCPEVNNNESKTAEGQSSREESPVQTGSSSMENDQNSKSKSLSPQLNAESFSSSKNDVVTAVSPTPKSEYDGKKTNKRRINDIASVLMSKKLKTSEA
ncbi:unnamed protein product [Auanema sp. JU1783]|nr:unnamed protein product [Auanema sp. JU1783]